MRAARDIEAGQQLFTTYHDLALPLSERRRAEAGLGFQDSGQRTEVESIYEVLALHDELHALYSQLNEDSEVRCAGD